MTGTKQADVKNTLPREFVILAVLVACTMLVLNVRYHDRVIDQSHGLVFYTPDVEKVHAVRLSNELTSIGVFDGIPRVIRLENADGTHQIQVAVAPETFDSVGTKGLLTTVFRSVCEKVFQDETAEVWLIDEHLVPRLLLLTYSGGK